MLAPFRLFVPSALAGHYDYARGAAADYKPKSPFRRSRSRSARCCGLHGFERHYSHAKRGLNPARIRYNCNYPVRDHSKTEAERENRLKDSRRIVIKVGTSTVTADDGQLCRERVEPIVRSIARLMKEGRQVVLGFVRRSWTRAGAGSACTDRDWQTS